MRLQAVTWDTENCHKLRFVYICADSWRCGTDLLPKAPGKAHRKHWGGKPQSCSSASAGSENQTRTPKYSAVPTGGPSGMQSTAPSSAQAEETGSSGPCQNQGCDLTRHSWKLLFSLLSGAEKAGRSELWGRAPLTAGWELISHIPDDTWLA